MTCATITEATAEGEAAWLAEMDSKAKMGEQFRSECTPGYYNNEGQLAARGKGLSSEVYAPGINAFNAVLAAWRETGLLEGFAVR